MYCYLGLTFGDFASGALSQLLKSRNKAVLTYLVLVSFLCIYFLYFLSNITVAFGHVIITALGFFGAIGRYF